jgi:hypothetical protein
MKNVNSKKDSHQAPKKRGPKSGYSYPYYNMEDSLNVAQLVHERGGGSCNRDQLASFLKYKSTNSGAFLARVNAAKMFGFISTEPGLISATERSRNIFAPVMPIEADQAKVDAFLSVPLFKAIFDKFRGNVLPPSDGLKNLLQHSFNIVKDRVTPAHRVLMESAEYAGYFNTHGDSTRLIQPLAGNTRTQPEGTPGPIKTSDSKPETLERRKLSSDGGGPPAGIHTAIIGLLRELPPIGESWESSKKERFFQAFKAVVEVVYPETTEADK